MDLYQILRVSINATQQEIDQAYHRLIRECRYNSRLNRKDIELAYGVLANPQQRAAYNAKLAMGTTTAIGERRRKKRLGAKSFNLTPTHKKVLLLALVLLTILFYAIRYGHLLQSFEEGDILYYKHGNRRMGRILKVEDNHNFGKYVLDAYLVETDKGKQWVPESIVKSYCYRP